MRKSILYSLMAVCVLSISILVVYKIRHHKTITTEALSFFPSANATEVCIDAPLRITFTSPPIFGKTGFVRVVDAETGQTVEAIDMGNPNATTNIGGQDDMHTLPIIVEGNEATFYPRGHALAYGKRYYVTLDWDVIQNAGDFATDESTGKPAWTFTTKSHVPDPHAAKIIVNADGKGDFCTVQAAIDSVPNNNTAPRTVYIRKGIYTEIVSFRNKRGLSIIGEDRKASIIQYANNNNFNGCNGGSSFRRGVLQAIDCTDLTIQNLTVRNLTPHGGGQAEAIILRGRPQSRQILSDVNLYSFQDTLQANGQAYIYNSYVEGDNDYLWGSGPCFFENCQFLTSRPRGMISQIRNPPGTHGFIFYRCNFDVSNDVKGITLSHISLPSFPASEVVLIQCKLTGITPAGWVLSGQTTRSLTRADAFSTRSLHFWEADSRDSQGNPIDASQRAPGSRQLDSAQDASTIANYSNPAFVLGYNWDARKSAKSLSTASIR